MPSDAQRPSYDARGAGQVDQRKVVMLTIAPRKESNIVRSQGV